MTTLPALMEQPCNIETYSEQTACAMARTYQETCAALRENIAAISRLTSTLETCFLGDDEHRIGNSFDLDYYFNGRSIYANRIDDLFTAYKKQAWSILVGKLGIRNIMSVKKREAFDRQLQSGEDLPEISEETIIGILSGLVGQVQSFAKEAALEVFDLLRPRGSWGSQYKTNDAFRVGRRVILSWYVESAYRGSFRVNYNHEKNLIAIDGIFHLLDGKGVMKEPRGKLVNAIGTSDGKGETDYFRFKCFKNRNLHLEFKRLDLVKQLNLLAAGEAVLGDDTE